MTTTRSAARVRTETRRILRLSAAAEIPAELRPGQLAALMAGCRQTDDRERYDVEAGLIADGIRDKLLAVIEKSKTNKPPPRKIGFVNDWKNQHYGRDPNMFIQPDPVTTRWLVVDRPAVFAWLDAIKETPGEYVRAWLGNECREEGQGIASPWSIAADSGPGELATTTDVRTALARATGDHFYKFKRALEDAPKWIKSARRDPAGNSKSAGYLWNVAQLAEVITEHYSLSRKTVAAAIAAQWPNAAELYGL